jgi:hypothetical protein
LREIFDEPSYPEVRFTASGSTLRCTPARAREEHVCEDTLQGSVGIRDVTKQVSVPISISTEENAFVVSGEFPIRWAEYGVEDPSIFLIAKVNPVASVRFRVRLSGEPEASGVEKH